MNRNLTLTLIFGLFIYISNLYSVSFQQDSLYNYFKQRNHRLTHFERKAIFRKITNDTLLLKIAVYSRYSYNGRPNKYFKYNSLLRIKNRELIYDKIDSLEFDLALFRFFIKDTNDKIYQKYLKGKARERDRHIDRKYPYLYILKKTEDFTKFIDEDILELFGECDVRIPAYKVKLEKNRIEEYFKSKKLNQNAFENLLYFALAKDPKIIFEIDTAKHNYSKEFLEAYKMISTYGLRRRLKEYKISDYTTKSKQELLKIIKAKSSSESEIISALLAIKWSVSDLDLIVNLQERYRAFIVQNINDDELLLKLFTARDDEGLKWAAFQKVNNKKVLKKMIDFCLSREKLRDSWLMKNLLEKYGDEELLYNTYFKLNEPDLQEEKQFFWNYKLFLKQDLLLKLLRINAEIFTDKSSSGNSIAVILALAEKYYKEIVFGNYPDRIKKEVIQFLSDEDFLTKIMKSDLSDEIKLCCVNQPFMANDSLLYEIALNEKTEHQLASGICKKLNINSLDDKVYKRKSNPQTRIKIVNKIKDKDSLKYYLYNDKDKEVRLTALKRFKEEKDFINHYYYFREKYDDEAIRSTIPGIYDLLTTCLQKISSNEALYQIALQEKDEHFRRRVISQKQFTDQKLLIKLLWEKYDKKSFSSFDVEKSLIQKITNDSLLENLCSKEANKKLFGEIVKRDYGFYNTKDLNPKYLFYTYKYLEDAYNKEIIIKILSKNQSYLEKILKIETAPELQKKINTQLQNIAKLIEETKEKIKGGKRVNWSDLNLFKKNPKELKWLYQNSKNPHHLELVIENTLDKELLLEILPKVRYDSENWNRVVEKLNSADFFNIINDPDRDYELKEAVLALIKKDEILKKIISGDYNNNFKQIALRSIEDQNFLYNYYLENNKSKKSIYHYNSSILEKLSDKFLTKLLAVTEDSLRKKNLLYHFDDEDVLEKSALDYNDYNFIGKIKSIERKRKIFWKSNNDKFRRNILHYCRSKDNQDNLRFYKKIISEEASADIKARALSNIYHGIKLSFLKETYTADTSLVVRKEVLSKINRIFIINSRDDTESLKIKDEAVGFLTNLYNDKKTDEALIKVIYNYLQGIWEKKIEKITHLKKIRELILKTKDPQKLHVLIRKYDTLLSGKNWDKEKQQPTKEYSAQINAFIWFYLDKINILNEEIISTLIYMCSEQESLKRLYTLAEKSYNKQKVISKITDNKFINKLAQDDSLDSVQTISALKALKDQTVVKELLEKHQANDLLQEILLWRCQQPEILDKIIKTAKNDTLVLVAKMKKEIINSNKDNFLVDFFRNWKKESIPATDEEIASMNDLEKDAHTLYNLYLARTYPDSLKSRYIVLPNKMYVTIDTTKAEDEDEFSEWYGSGLRKEIENFRPSSKSHKEKILYLDKKYRKVIENYIKYCLIDINKFLDDKKFRYEYTEFNRFSSEEDYRSLLLRKYMPIFEGHWGGYYILHTHPVVTSISFNNKRTVANLHFTSGFSGSAEIFVKKEGKWQYSHHSESYWIE